MYPNFIYLFLILFTLEILFVLCCIPGVYLLLAFFGSVIPLNKSYNQKEVDVECYLSSDGIHTDFVLPLVNTYFDWRVLLDQDHYEMNLDQNTYLGIGWGDKGFYLDIATWDDLTLKVAAKAILIPSPTLMHIIAYRDLPTEKKKLPKFSHCICS